MTVAYNARFAPSVLPGALKDLLGDRLGDVAVHERAGGKDGTVQFQEYWFDLAREDLLFLVDGLGALDAVHFHVMSGDDLGECVQLVYHFSLGNAAGRGARVGIFARVSLPKNNLSVPSLWSRIPGVEYSEREMREFLGVTFEGLPNTASIFLPEDWNEDVKPWRRDGAGLAPEHVRELS